VAVIVARPGAKPDPEQLLSTLKQQLANFKIPKRCFIVPDLPCNTMGKVQKNLLREEYKNLFA
jgi:malonyl-CoA/methylmalonyl-CoA synthetase